MKEGKGGSKSPKESTGFSSELPESFEVEHAFNVDFFFSSSSAYDTKTRQKVAVKKLSRPFQSLIHARRTYRELRLLKHMKHENVSGERVLSLRISVTKVCNIGLIAVRYHLLRKVCATL